MFKTTRQFGRILAVLTGVAGLLATGNARAVTVLGEIWTNITTASDASIIPPGSPDAKFFTPAIDYNSDLTGYTVETFLNHPTFFNTSVGFNPSGVANNIFIRFTGQTFLNAGINSFVVPHDDGLVLTFADPSIGVVLNQPGPTAPVNSPFDVNAPASGLYDFTLLYAECCGAPAVLGFKVNDLPVGGDVPEPATITLIGLGLVGAGMLRRRRRAA